VLQTLFHVLMLPSSDQRIDRMVEVGRVSSCWREEGIVKQHASATIKMHRKKSSNTLSNSEASLSRFNCKIYHGVEVIKIFRRPNRSICALAITTEAYKLREYFFATRLKKN
jgi:hypothetical protein